jgi:plasmid stability protein
MNFQPVTDVRMNATLRIRELDPDAPLNWMTYPVPLTNGGASALVDAYYRADDFMLGRFSRKSGLAGLEIAARGHTAIAVAAMRNTCHHRPSMSSMIQIRNVPDELHRDLKVRAVHAGMTLSDFLLSELRALAVRPTMREWLDRSATWESVEVSESPADAIAAERGRSAA